MLLTANIITCGQNVSPIAMENYPKMG